MYASSFIIYPLVKFKGMMENKKHELVRTWRSVCRVHNRRATFLPHNTKWRTKCKHLYSSIKNTHFKGKVCKKSNQNRNVESNNLQLIENLINHYTTIIQRGAPIQ